MKPERGDIDGEPGGTGEIEGWGGLTAEGYGGIEGWRIFFDEGEGGGDGGEGGSGEGGSGGDGTGGDGDGDGKGGSGGSGGDGGSGGGDPPTLPEGAIFLNAFKEHLPENLRTDPSVAKYSSIEDLAKGLVNQAKMIGKPADSLIERPKADASFDDKLAILKNVFSLPETTESYTLTVPDKAPEWLDTKGELATEFVKKSHELGIMPEQTAGMYQWFSELMMTTNTDIAAETKNQGDLNEAELKAEWGPAYDAKLRLADYALDKLSGGKEAGQALRDKINNSSLVTDPGLMKILASVGEMIREDSDNPNDDDFGDSTTGDEHRAHGKHLLAQSYAEKDPLEAKRLQVEAQKSFKLANPKMVPGF